jgi:hypothetical protein
MLTMKRPTLLTPAVLAQVPGWVHGGRTTEEIAGLIGCTVGTLRVRCSKAGISLRRPRPGEPPKPPKRPPSHLPRMSVALPPSIMGIIEQHAGSKGVSGRKLAATLLETIATDNLFAAVLDDA